MGIYDGQNVPNGQFVPCRTVWRKPITVITGHNYRSIDFPFLNIIFHTLYILYKVIDTEKAGEKSHFRLNHHIGTFWPFLEHFDPDFALLRKDMI